jgi:hypothetical protein
VIEDFEEQMREAVNEDTAGKRRNETTWKVRRKGWRLRCCLPCLAGCSAAMQSKATAHGCSCHIMLG